MRIKLPTLVNLFIASFAVSSAFANPLSAPSHLQESFDQTVIQALDTFATPGMSVGVVYQGKVVKLQGYGLRDFTQPEPVDIDTYFRLASTSKAFTAAAMAKLVSEGRVDWQDKVIDHFPEFRMQDHWVTGEFRILDLFTHQSGLVGGAGDAMLWPEPTGFSREEIFANMAHLTPVTSFRSAYAYNNLMYMVAGEIIAKVSGVPFAEYIDTHFFKAMDMTCFAGDMDINKYNNLAASHGDIDGEVFAIPRNGIFGKELVSAAAGGMVCNASNMVKWLQVLLNHGQTATGEQIIDSAQLDYMWRSHTNLSVSSDDRRRDDTHFKTYGIGWRKADVFGFEVISHTGTLSGVQAYVALVPELELGVVLLNNGSNSAARGAIMQTILKGFMPDAPQIDWIADYQQWMKDAEARYYARLKLPVGTGEVNLPIIDYQGDFKDAWYGNVALSPTDNQLQISFDKMENLNGTLIPFRNHTFEVDWQNKNAASRALLVFDVDANGEVTGFKLQPFNAKVPANHNWRDMYFIKQVE